MFRRTFSFFRNRFLRNQTEHELSDELKFYLESLIEEKIRAGMEPEEARRAARIELGGMEQVKENVRDARIGAWLNSLLMDLRYALRMLRKNPSFTLVALLTLALGIGANTTIFSIVDAVLLRPFPYKDSSRLVEISSSRKVTVHSGCSLADYLQIKAESRTFEQAAAYGAEPVISLANGMAVTAWKEMVSSEFLPMVGVSPTFGRVFLSEEYAPGHDAVTILSHSLWQRQFGSDPTVLGKLMLIDRTPYTVVGVMPASSDLDRTDMWVPFDPIKITQATPHEHVLGVWATLRHGVSIKQAQGVLNSIATRIEQESPHEEENWDLFAMSFFDTRTLAGRDALLVLFGAVGFVLLIACVNLASLCLARGWTRQRELAIRSALGATRRGIVRQLLVESMLLALAGGALGTLLASWSIRLLRSSLPAFPRMNEIGFDYRIFLFVAAVSILSAILFGLAPALQLSKQDMNSAIKGTKGMQSTGQFAPRGINLRNCLIVSEVVFSLVLLIGATVTVRSLHRMLSVDFGFRTDHILSVEVLTPRFKYPTPKETKELTNRILARVKTLTGVEAVAADLKPLLIGGARTYIAIAGRPEPQVREEGMLQTRAVTQDYFLTLGLPILNGRGFDKRDSESGAPVAIVNEAFARRYFPSGSPVGKRLFYYEDAKNSDVRTLREIVGVVPDVRDIAPFVPFEPMVYVPFAQHTEGYPAAYLAIRTVSDPLQLSKAIEDQIRSIDKDLPIQEVVTVDQRIYDMAGYPRIQSILLGAFAALGLVLAVVGIYGVVAYSVTQRTQEVGIRLALGARQIDVLQLVIKEAMLPVVAGLAVGIVGALALTRVMSSFLYGLFEVKPSDPANFGITLLLASVALLACYIPARRAMRVDPMIALRHE